MYKIYTPSPIRWHPIDNSSFKGVGEVKLMFVLKAGPCSSYDVWYYVQEYIDQAINDGIRGSLELAKERADYLNACSLWGALHHRNEALRQTLVDFGILTGAEIPKEPTTHHLWERHHDKTE